MRKFLIPFVVFLLILSIVLGVMAYRTVHWNRPELPDTKLSGLTLQTYLYSVGKLSSASAENPVGLSLSPEETSFLLENIKLDYSYRGYDLIDIKIDNSGENILVDFVLQGPLSLYYRGTFQGTVEYAKEHSRWTAHINRLEVGAFPLSYLFVGPYHPRWSNSLMSGRVRVNDLRLDGKGLRVTLSRFGLDLGEAVDFREASISRSGAIPRDDLQ